jgi:uncharacterized protein YsxB (DUF464 family)
MFKQLKNYYIIVSLPFALLLIGSAGFFDAIKLTISRNPHPQINYTIFAIILIGGVLIILNARRLIREAKTLVGFSRAIHAKTDSATLQKMANGYTGETSCLLQMVAASGGRSISHQEQAAIEHELTNTRASLIRRNALPQYLTGLLVGMGLLGTFIGLLATLNDISVLISSFADIDMQNASPLLVFRTMIERMKAPMQSMGIAFSASMFGLLGSIILGLMMVGLRRLQGDIFSLLSSEIARHIELALSHESIVFSGEEVNTGGVAKALIRIEERYAEAARSQQRALSSLIDDIQKQRTDMLRALTEQTEASNNFRGELQQLGRQLGSIFNVMEKGNGEISAQISELTVHMAGDAKETHKLLAMQVDEQKRLRDTLDSYKIEERIAEAARSQQRVLSSVIDDFQQQRAEMLRSLAEQTDSNNNSRGEMKQLGGQLNSIFNIIEKGNDEVSTQISELTVHMAADAKESHLILDNASASFRSELQQLGNQLGTVTEKGNDEICTRISELMRHMTADAKKSYEQLDNTSNTLRSELQQLGSQLGTSFNVMEKGNDEICARISELMSHMAADAKKSYEQLENANKNFRSELQQLDSRLGTSFNVMEKGNDEICTRISEMIVHMAAAAKGSHELFGSANNNFRSELQQLGTVMEKGNDEICTQISELLVHMANAKESNEMLAIQVDKRLDQEIHPTATQE